MTTTLKVVVLHRLLWGFPDGSGIKNPPANTGDPGSIPVSRRSPGVGNGNLLQYSCWENPVNRGAWRAAAHEVANSWRRLSTPSGYFIKLKVIINIDDTIDSKGDGPDL